MKRNIKDPVYLPKADWKLKMDRTIRQDRRVLNRWTWADWVQHIRVLPQLSEFRRNELADDLERAFNRLDHDDQEIIKLDLHTGYRKLREEVFLRERQQEIDTRPIQEDCRTAVWPPGPIYEGRVRPWRGGRVAIVHGGQWRWASDLTPEELSEHKSITARQLEGLPEPRPHAPPPPAPAASAPLLPIPAPARPAFSFHPHSSPPEPEPPTDPSRFGGHLGADGVIYPPPWQEGEPLRRDWEGREFDWNAETKTWVVDPNRWTGY